MSLFSFLVLPSKAIVVIAVVINTITIDLKHVVIESLSEEPAPSRKLVDGAGYLPVEDEFRINKLVVDHKVSLRLYNVSILESHDTVTNQLSPYLNSYERIPTVVLVDEHSQIRDVFACVRLSGKPEVVFGVFFELGEEINNSFEVVLGNLGIVVGEVFLKVDRIPNSCGRL